MPPSKETSSTAIAGRRSAFGDWGWQKQTKYIVDPGFYKVPNPLRHEPEDLEQAPQEASGPA